MDLVQFPRPVVVTEVRVVPLGTRVVADVPGNVRLGWVTTGSICWIVVLCNLCVKSPLKQSFVLLVAVYVKGSLCFKYSVTIECLFFLYAKVSVLMK